MKLRYEKCKASRVFKEPYQKINERYVSIDMDVKALQNCIINKIKDSRTLSVETISKLDALSPLKTLTRGYCIAEHNDKIIKSVNDLNVDDKITLKFTDGEKLANIL